MAAEGQTDEVVIFTGRVHKRTLVNSVLRGYLNGQLADTPLVTGMYHVHELNYTSEMAAPGWRAH
eukprot:3175978-Pyramimonas_sp.AAC.1